MNSELSATVYRPADRNVYYVQWVDPVTGKKKTRSTGKDKKRDADRVAGEILASLRDGRLETPSRIRWSEFRERFEREVVASQAAKTAAIVTTALNAIESYVNPKLLVALSSSEISKFQKKLRDDKKSEATIKTYLTHLKVALRWAKRMNMIRDVPDITMPKRAGLMKGRPITTEEFERMLLKTTDVVGTTQADSWKFLLNGLWWSGLRLGEALILSWDENTGFEVDLNGKHPMFNVSATAEKGKQNRLLPMAPEFATQLESVTTTERTGYVFSPMAQRGNRSVRRVDTASSTIVAIGKAAGVKACDKESGRVKYASAHDLRRSFGFRWSMRVMPPVLMQLMRHESIQTTQEFYVGRNAEVAASVVWDAFEKATAPESQETSENPA